MSQTDAMLLDHWRRERNADAFRVLATRYAGMVYHTCRRILNNPAEAEDVAQECFLTLAATEKPVGGYLAPWLHRVACNRALARLRGEQRRREREARYAADHPATAEMQWDEIQAYVDEAIAALPDKLRGPVVAHFLDGMSHEAAARMLDVPRSTVTHRIDQGVECLRRTLAARGVTAGTAVALAGVLEAHTASAAAPPTLVAALGKLALSGAGAATASAAALAQGAAGFWTAKTIVATVAGAAVVLFGGWHAVKSVTAPAPPRPVVAQSTRSAPPAAPPKSSAAQAGSVQADKKDSEVPTPATGTPVQARQAPPPLPPPPQRSWFPSLGEVRDVVLSAWQNLRNTLNGENDRRRTCQNNLKQLGLVVKIFANEAPKQFFPMQRTAPGAMMFANTYEGLNPVAPEYLTDKRVLVCPDDAKSAPLLDKGNIELLDHCSYYYLGYAVTTQEQFDAFAAAFRQQRAQGLAYDHDLETPNGPIYRLREGVERMFITDINNPAASAMAQSNTPVFIEEPRHDPPGGNILYMDGHVEFRRYAPNGDFPMNQRTLDTLRSLAK